MRLLNKSGAMKAKRKLMYKLKWIPCPVHKSWAKRAKRELIYKLMWSSCPPHNSEAKRAKRMLFNLNLSEFCAFSINLGLWKLRGNLLRNNWMISHYCEHTPHTNLSEFFHGFLNFWNLIFVTYGTIEWSFTFVNSFMDLQTNWPLEIFATLGTIE